jgi:signal transduction histidine kinase
VTSPPAGGGAGGAAGPPRRAGQPVPRPWAGTGWPLSRLITVAIAVMALFSIAAIIVGTVALVGLSNARNRAVGKLDPAAFEASQLYTALLNQETGVRGYALSADSSFLAPYTAGEAAQQMAVARLRRLLPGMPAAQSDLAQVVSLAGRWRTDYAQPTIKQVAASGKPLISQSVLRGKADFDAMRRPLGVLQTNLSKQHGQAVAALTSSGNALDVASVGIAVGLLAIVTALTLGMRSVAIRPLSQLAADARRVADGDFGHQVGRTGPREIQDLGADVDLMRQRILRELSSLKSALASLETRTQDLQRSNAELEQFAYVASHDLQEPLRKVASFCQLLERRYAGRLDERADQYIEYAVDGAKRMQVLINDLLAFSRVGRSAGELTLVSCTDLLAQARGNLAPAIRKSRAVITADELPVVRAEPALLTAVFQNLLSNAIKFRGEEQPRVEVTARRDGDFWLFSVSDTGIGIDADYAERIFVIFQRLHERSSYPGTGIGLAMCRKIIEYHGGQIWLDTEYTGGSRFLFTLPAPADLPADSPPADTPSADDPPADTSPEENPTDE